MTLLRCRAFAIAALAYAGLAACTLRGPWTQQLHVYLALHAVAWAAAWRAAHAPLGARDVLIGALLFRAVLVPLEPALSDDIYRYVWEGRVQRAGFDPYVLPPAAAELAPLRDADVWPRVNHPEHAAIYPPLAQAWFRILAGLGGVTAFKVAFVAADMAMLALLARLLRRRGRPPAALALYAWNPLAVVEVAASGHLEPLGLLPLVAALAWCERHPASAGAALGASVAVKYAAAGAVPFLVRGAPGRLRLGGAAAAVLAAAFVVYAGAGLHIFDSLRAYAEGWRYNDLVHSLLSIVLPAPRASRAASAALFAGACVWLWRRRARPEAGVQDALLVAVLVSPTIHPWYLLWPLALLPLRPSAAVLVWSATLPLSYLFLYPAFGAGPAAAGSWGLLLLEMLPVAAAALPVWRRPAPP